MVLFVWPSLDSENISRTRSQPRASYQYPSTSRSTSDIVTACLATSMMNFILSLRSLFSDSHQSYDRKSLTERFFAWAVFFIFPELAMAYAYAEYQDARDDYLLVVRTYNRWTLRHSFFAKMDGFALVRKKESIPVSSGRQILEQGAKLENEDCERLGREIEIKSYTDSLPSLIVNIQVFRFLLGISTREFASLPLSPLEYVSCSHILCTLLIRAFWNSKPIRLYDKINIPLPASNSFFGRRQKRSNYLIMPTEKSEYLHV